MPDHLSQTIPPPTSSPDARANVWLDDLRNRGIAFAVGLILALFLAVVPLPFSPSTSATQIVIEVIGRSWYEHFTTHQLPRRGMLIYVQVSLMLAILPSCPVLLHHALDLATPAALPKRARRLSLTLLAALFSALWVS